MIKNIIFDLGGVLVDLEKERCINSFTNIGFDVTPYIGQYEQKGVFRQLELGEISDREFLDAIDCPANDEQKAKAWTDFLVGLPEHRKQAILDLRQRGFNTYLLSNTNNIDWQFAEREYFNINGHKTEDYFIHTFLSFHMHLMKPDLEIFRQALAQAGLNADETLFIDDSTVNCAAANKLGIRTICAIGDEWIERLAHELY